MCTATPQLGQLQESYTDNGVQGPLICDMAYPTVGPGVIYDPTGSTTKINESAGGQVISNACIPASTISGALLRKGQSCDQGPIFVALLPVYSFGRERDGHENDYP